MTSEASAPHGGQLLTDPDDALLRRMRAGGADADLALQELLALMGNRLQRDLQRLGATPAQAEELLGDVFIHARDRLHRFSGKGSLRGWIYTMAKNALIDLLRREQLWRKPGPSENEDADEADGGDPQAWLMRLVDAWKQAPSAEHDVVLRRLLDCVRMHYGAFAVARPNWAEDFDLAFHEGMRSAELARRRGMSDDAMRTQLTRTRADLRERLKPCRDHIPERVPWHNRQIHPHPMTTSTSGWTKCPAGARRRIPPPMRCAW